jgi:hypothetical protein
VLQCSAKLPEPPALPSTTMEYQPAVRTAATFVVV